MDKRLLELYQEIEFLLNYEPAEGDCTDEENKMYSDMANLKDSMFNAIYGKLAIIKM